MKKNVVILSALILGLVSCESNSNSYVPHAAEMYMRIVKIPSPENLQYVVAEMYPVSNDSNGFKIRNNGGVFQELYLGTNPYIELSDDYYCVDWKWGDFIYIPTNVLIDVLWMDVTNRQQYWSIETSLIAENFSPQNGYISRRQIDSYLGTECSVLKDTNLNLSIDYAEPWFIRKFNTLEEFLNGVKVQNPSTYANIESYQSEVVRQDSLQIVYVERLKQIIKEGQLQKLLKDWPL